MFHTRSTLIEDINFIMSRIIRMNNKLGELKREHKHDRRSLPSDKTNIIRCTKCEGYGYENYQCPNWNAKYVTLQELQNYIAYLKEVKMSVRQKLEVRREQQAKRERETAERTLKEIWKKARQDRENAKIALKEMWEKARQKTTKREKRARAKRAREEKAKRKKRDRDERKKTKDERAYRKKRERVKRTRREIATRKGRRRTKRETRERVSPHTLDMHG